MFTPFARACLLLFVATLAASAGGGQPPDGKKKEFEIKGLRPHYTAFPDLKPPDAEKDAVPLPPLPVLAADAPPLRKVQFEQLQEGLQYLERVKAAIEIAGPDERSFAETIKMSCEVYRVAAELEEKPAKRVPWYEARVLTFKKLELYTERRLKAGAFHPKSLNTARFERLQAEADLLKLKAEVEKAGK